MAKTGKLQAVVLMLIFSVPYPCFQVSDIQGLVCMWPGILMANADTQLQPWLQYMQTELGCSAVQVGEIINASPHLKPAGKAPAVATHLGHLQGHAHNMAERDHAVVIHPVLGAWGLGDMLEECSLQDGNTDSSKAALLGYPEDMCTF
eukprot:scaffold22408_cov20-Tisochrysis_lutea.AAC.1